MMLGDSYLDVNILFTERLRLILPPLHVSHGILILAQPALEFIGGGHCCYGMQ